MLKPKTDDQGPLLVSFRLPALSEGLKCSFRPYNTTEILEKVAPEADDDEKGRLEATFHRLMSPHVAKQSGLMMAHALSYQLRRLMHDTTINTLSPEQKYQVAQYLVGNVAYQMVAILKELGQFTEEAYIYRLAPDPENRTQAKTNLETTYKGLGLAFGKLGLMLSGLWKKGEVG